MLNFIADDNKRLSIKDDLTQLPAKLPGLATKLREKAAVWTSLATGFGSELNEAQAQVLNAVAEQVQALIDVTRTPAETLTELRAIVERTEREQSIAETLGQAQIESALGELSSRQADPAQIMGRLAELMGQVNFGETAKGMAAKGRAQGMGNAAAIVRWFINDFPA